MSQKLLNDPLFTIYDIDAGPRGRSVKFATVQGAVIVAHALCVVNGLNSCGRYVWYAFDGAVERLAEGVNAQSQQNIFRSGIVRECCGVLNDNRRGAASVYGC